MTLASLQRRDGAHGRVFTDHRQTPHAPSAKRREVFGESHERVSCILVTLRTGRETDFGTPRDFLHMHDSFEVIHSFSGVIISRQQ